MHDNTKRYGTKWNELNKFFSERLGRKLLDCFFSVLRRRCVRLVAAPFSSEGWELWSLLTLLTILLFAVRYTAGMVWFNEKLDKWLQLRQTVMKVAPVPMTTDVNNNHVTDNQVEQDPPLQQQQQQQQQRAVAADAVSASGTPVTATSPPG